MGEEQMKSKEEKKQETPKTEEKNGGKKEEKKSEKPKTEDQPPPPQEIILKVYMHCEGCARKIHRSLKGFAGVENVMTDCRNGKVVVRGEKADPLKVLERIQKKSHRQVELISPIPKPAAAAEPQKPEEKETVITVEKKEEPPAVTVVLGVYMHCEACAQEIKKRIQKMKGVESADPDLKNSHVVVKGVFEPQKLVEYVHKRTSKHAEIKKIDPEKKEKEKEGEDVKKVEEAKKEPNKGKAENKDIADSGVTATEPPPVAGKPDGAAAETTEDSKLDLRKNEFYYYPQNNQFYPQRLVPGNMYSYPPQIFSDENPNACSVM